MAKCKNCKWLELNNLTGKKRCFLLGEVKEIESVRFCGAYRPMTNADRIRSMTDEQLAYYLHGFSYGDGLGVSADKILRWLKSEVEE